MHEIRANIASNLQRLRQREGFTQQDLATRLNYTDKAVSKWERGESTPDITVLKAIADIFNVTVDDLIADPRKQLETKKAEPESASVPAGDKEETSAEQTNMAKLASVCGFSSVRRFTVTLMAGMAVWLAAVIVFVSLTVFVPEYTRPWVCFVFAVPATSIVLLIFNLLWGRMDRSFALMAVCVWTVLASLFTFFIAYQPWTLFLIGLPAQAIILLWQVLHNRRHK